MRQIVLLRGINVGKRNRISMPELRDVLQDAGFEDVRTYLQSGNVVVSSDSSPDELARACEKQIAVHFGLAVDVVARTRDELANVVRRNPLGDVATDPKRYQVTFLSAEVAPETASTLARLAAKDERFVAAGRELYAWHPAGIGRSRLWGRLASKELGVTATSRNWTTVTKLLAIADDR